MRILGVSRLGEGKRHANGAPRSPLEAALVELWRAELGVDGVGIFDDFFALGGDSMRAARIIASIESTRGVRVPVVALLHAPTIAGLAARIEQTEESWSPLVPMQPNGRQPPVFCVHGGDGFVVKLKDLAHALGPDQPFYGFEAPGLNGATQPLRSLEEMAALYVSAMKTVQPSGPYFLGGFSLGAVVAFEMAQQLLARGDRVGLLVLLDPSMPQVDILPLEVRARRLRWRTSLELRTALSAPVDYAVKNTRRLRRVRDSIAIRVGLKPRPVKPPVVIPPDSWVNDVTKAIGPALRAYRVRPYAGHVLHLRVPRLTDADRRHQDVFEDWGAVVPRSLLRVRDVPGTHLQMLAPPHVSTLAAFVAEALTDARAGRWSAHR